METPRPAAKRGVRRWKREGLRRRDAIVFGGIGRLMWDGAA